MEKVKDYRILSLIFVLLISLSCSAIIGGIDRFNILSDTDEEELGRQVKQEIESTEKVINDAIVTNHIKAIGEKIAPYLPQRSFKYNFNVLENDAVNAFATPGGHCYVYTGLIKFAGSEAELASVIAHECAHVAAKHIGRQLTKQYAYGILIGAALGSDSSIAAEIAAQLAGTGMGLAYSRRHEYEADSLGMRAMHNAGFDPREMIEFFKKLATQETQNDGIISKYLSTHPSTQDRIETLEEEIAKLDLNTELICNTKQFEEIKERIK